MLYLLFHSCHLSFTETVTDTGVVSGECADTGAPHEIVADICPFGNEIDNGANNSRGPAELIMILSVLPFALFLAF